MKNIQKGFVYASPFAIVFMTHYFATNLYTSICASMSIKAFLRSLVVTGSPLCGTLLSIINYTHNSYGVIIAGFGTAIVHQLTNWCKCKEE